MKVFCISVLEHGKPAKMLISEADLSSFSYFQRSSVQEGMNFFIATVAERTARGSRATVEQNQYTGHIYVRMDGLAVAIVTDAEYPSRVAFSVLAKIADEFNNKFRAKKVVTSAEYPELKDHLQKAQDPGSSDPFMKVQRELDETKVILHKTMDTLLQRGEVLDDLVDKSNQLSTQSKMFYKTAKKTNSSCCSFT